MVLHGRVYGSFQFSMNGSEGEDETHRSTFKKAIALNPDHVIPRAFLTAVYVDLGRLNEVQVTADNVMQRHPRFSASRFMQSHCLHDPMRDTRFIGLLQRAGLTEWPL